MKQEWILVKDLLGIGGLPKTVQGIHQKAKAEKWRKKSVAQEGVRGRSYAYNFEDLPPQAQAMLTGENPSTQPALISREGKGQSKDKFMNVFNSVWEGLEPKEMDLLSKLLARKGAELLTLLLDKDNIALMLLTGEQREAALLLMQLDPIRVREILSELRASRGVDRTASQQAVGEHREDLA
ncbi:DNA-binding protein [Salmonella enterica]|nr:DNA-binding protein [Salmonella enterica]